MKQALKPVYVKTNVATNMQAEVYLATQWLAGYNVVLKDLDSGNTLPVAFTFPAGELDRAKLKADSLVKV